MEAAPTFISGPARRFAPSPLSLALTLTAALTALRTTGSVDSDVAWQLWIAGRLHAGARLYRDIIEVNPPLWFWFARPIDGLARLFGARPETVLVWVMGSLVALALGATDRLLSSMPAKRRRLLLCYAALALMALPWVHLGQREHIVLVATLPYAALTATRRQGKEVAPLLSAAIGAGAALGFALKHYFLLTPVLLELWLFFCSGSRWRLLRPETIAIAIGGALYAGAMVLWASAYVTDIIPLISLAYGAIGSPSAVDLFGPSALIGLSLLCFVASQARWLAEAKAPLATALLICGAAFAGAYFIQFKGWPYQAIPMIGCASLSLAALMAETPSLPRTLRIVSPALLVLPLALALAESRHTEAPTIAVSQAVADLNSGESVGFLATDNAMPWSVTLQHGFRYPSRYMSFWMLNAVVRNELRGNPNPKLQELGRLVVSQTVQDFRCAPPQRLIVVRPSSGGDDFDIFAFFRRDPKFSELMTRYKRSDSPTLQTYERVGALPRPETACRIGV